MSTHNHSNGSGHGHAGHSPEDIARQVRIYMKVFGTLLVLTIVTVLASYVSLPIAVSVAIALTIATFKSGLVAAFFMHLKWERRIIFAILALTVFFFLILLVSPSINRF